MNTQQQIAEIEAKNKAEKRAGFDRFMDQPATRMMISMIPAGEHREVLETLLHEAFNNGYGCGGASTAGSFMDAILKGMDKRAADRGL